MADDVTYRIGPERSAPNRSMFLASRASDAITLYYGGILEHAERLSGGHVKGAFWRYPRVAY